MKRGNSSKGPFKGKRETGATVLNKHGDRIQRLNVLDAKLAQTRDAMNEVVSGLNHTYSSMPLRARVHSTGGCLAIRLVWRKSVSDVAAIEGKPDNSFDLTGSAGRSLLEYLNSIQTGAADNLINIDRRRVMLNHRYRHLFNERRSLRKLHQYEKSIRTWQREHSSNLGGPVWATSNH